MDGEKIKEMMIAKVKYIGLIGLFGENEVKYVDLGEPLNTARRLVNRDEEDERHRIMFDNYEGEYYRFIITSEMKAKEFISLCFHLKENEIDNFIEKNKITYYRLCEEFRNKGFR